MRRTCLGLLVLCSLLPVQGQTTRPFGERIVELRSLDARIQINYPEMVLSHLPTRIVLYCLPNGNSIEWTVGCQRREGLDWHYDIQHIGAQVRRWREINQRENILIAYLEADAKSWPRYRQEFGNDRLPRLLEEIGKRTGAVSAVTLVAHSGGGSFISGLIEALPKVPATIDRIVLLDANYSFDEQLHAEKLLDWLKKPDRRLIVMAYDDRNVELNGKRIVSDTGGTFRATGRMIDRFSKDMEFEPGKLGDFQARTALNGQIRVLVHPNPHNKILHTTMVGEMSGFLYSMCVDTPAETKWGTLQGEKTWEKWIQPPPEIPTTSPGTQPARNVPAKLTIPLRPQSARGGMAFMRSIENLPREAREEAIAKEFLSGNVPPFLRHLKSVNVKELCVDGIVRTVHYQVMCDYLAIGSDEDFVRVPMNPHTAQRIADAFGCSLPTRKMVNDIDAHALVRLEPRPLTEAREAVTTFLEHHQIIEAQRKGKPPGEILCGIKKDIVITNRLLEKPNRVAIYGWRKLDNTPIQPLTIVHVDWYVDYSHGVRLVQREVNVSGTKMAIDDVLRDPHLHVLLSDEGALKTTRYEQSQ